MAKAPTKKTTGASSKSEQSLYLTFIFSLEGSKNNKPYQNQVRLLNSPRVYAQFSLLPTTGGLFKTVILNITQRHIEGRNLLNASQFGFCADHSMTLHCRRLTDHVTLNFNNKMSTAAVLLDIEKAFVAQWHPGLLYKLSKLEFLTNIMKLIS
jgi:hypothetical protein